ncbi:fibrinogen beta chain-like [Physella acuta]|uniref:fibrinogen beta chain-like n=1 Tax=Physella acuta TaxID=109671 RepID=UPI0027DC0D57|nr:fibrinogen beta chain-like [Physella acuta]
MSVYRIDGNMKTPLASILASDSRVRDYNVDGVEVDGKISTKTVEMTVSVTQETGCQDGVWACDVHYVDSTGHIGKREKKTRAGSRKDMRSFLDLNIQSEGSEISMSIERLNHLTDRDLNMKLKLSSCNPNNNKHVDANEFNKEKQRGYQSKPLEENNEVLESAYSNERKFENPDENSKKQDRMFNRHLRSGELNTKINNSASLINNVTNLQNIARWEKYRLNYMSSELPTLSEKDNNLQEQYDNMEQDFIKKFNQLKSRIAVLENSNDTQYDLKQSLDLYNLQNVLFAIDETKLHLKNSLDYVSLILNVTKFGTQYGSDIIRKIFMAMKYTIQENEILKTLLNRRFGFDRHSQLNPYNRRHIAAYGFEGYWLHYKDGFGKLSENFWLGNDWISRLTSIGYTELRIDMKYKTKHYYATYSNFTVGDETTQYKMSYSSYNGNATDGLKDHNGMKFSTRDDDNDKWWNGQCVKSHTGGWWFNQCLTSNLNGEWASKEFGKGIIWGNLTGWRDSLEFTEMKLRLP